MVRGFCVLRDGRHLGSGNGLVFHVAKSGTDLGVIEAGSDGYAKRYHLVRIEGATRDVRGSVRDFSKRRKRSAWKKILGPAEANASVVKRSDSSRATSVERSVDARETHPGAGTRVTFGEAVVDFDASRAVGADESQGSAGHAAIVRENFHSDRSNRSKRADAGAEGAEDETVREERVKLQI